MLERQRMMLNVLTSAEQHMLFELMAKMVISSTEWPAAIEMEPQS